LGVLEHHGRHVRDGMLDRVRSLDPLVAQKIGEAGNSGQRGHHEADEQQPLGRARKPALSLGK